MKLFIYDEEQFYEDVLKQVVETMLNINVHVFCLDDKEQLEAALNDEQIDLLFVDVDCDGIIDIIDQYKYKLPSTILLSHAPEHVIRLHSHKIMDYLIKPFSLQEAYDVIELYSESLIRNEVVAIKNLAETHYIILRKVMYTIQREEWVDLVMRDKTITLNARTFRKNRDKYLHAVLVQISKDHYINFDYVLYSDHRLVVMQDGYEMEVTRQFKDVIKAFHKGYLIR